MKIGIIIINYNGKELVKNCLNSIINSNLSGLEKDVIVVDNGSNDGSVELLEKKYKNIILIKLDYNSGFCKANNQGIRLALNNNCQAVVLLNNDTIVDSDFFLEITKVINNNEKIGMIAPKVVFMKENNRIDSVGISITPDGLGKNRGLRESSEIYNKKEEIFCPAGAAMLYTKDLLNDIRYKDNYFDEDFGFYLEDLDLGWRARLRGWKCVYNPKALVYHLGGATSGSHSEFVAYYTNRNILLNVIKNYPLYLMIKAVFLTIFRYLLLTAGIFFKKGPGYKIKNNIGIAKTIKITIKGWISLSFKIPNLIKKRSYIQKNKLVKNEEIRGWFGNKTFSTSFLKSIYK
jgi:GT2 family glycosyltransferase